jgi:hypothetical protein
MHTNSHIERHERTRRDSRKQRSEPRHKPVARAWSRHDKRAVL